jgi:hypothetical protein
VNGHGAVHVVHTSHFGCFFALMLSAADRKCLFKAGPYLRMVHRCPGPGQQISRGGILKKN